MLSSRQLQTLPHILNSPSYEEAARRVGISPKQIYSWLKQPSFREELKKQRNDLFCNALSILKSSTQKAVQTLIALLDNEDPRLRLLASEKILSNAFKGVVIFEFDERISGLELIAEKVVKQRAETSK